MTCQVRVTEAKASVGYFSGAFKVVYYSSKVISEEAQSLIN